MTIHSRDRALLARHAAQMLPRFGEEAYATRLFADTTSDLATAREKLRRRTELAPSDLDALESYVRVLLRSDLVEDAERQIEIGLGAAPGSETLQALRALIAIRRQKWDEAYALAGAYAAEHPDDMIASEILDRVRRIHQLDDAERTAGASRLKPIAPTAERDEPETRALLLTHEGIGRDCEFGFLQRCFGAEPLGLLRWTDTSLPSLMAALSARFEGVGEPANMELVVSPEGEIHIRDKRWHLAMHTFLYETEVSLAVLYPKMCRRTAYLRDKLLQDLQSGRKTLVFKSERIDYDALIALHDALTAFGPNRLIAVLLASDGLDLPPGEPGSVVEIRPGLFVGRLSRMGDLENLAIDEWVEICRSVEDARERASAVDQRPAPAYMPA